MVVIELPVDAPVEELVDPVTMTLLSDHTRVLHSQTQWPSGRMTFRWSYPPTPVEVDGVMVEFQGKVFRFSIHPVTFLQQDILDVVLALRQIL